MPSRSSQFSTVEYITLKKRKKIQKNPSYLKYAVIKSHSAFHLNVRSTTSQGALTMLYTVFHVLIMFCFFRFVLYQMSKNMNRRIFYMFLVRLASVPEPTACNISSRDHVLKRANRMQVYLTGIISQQLITCCRSACNISSMDYLFQNIFRWGRKKMFLCVFAKARSSEEFDQFPRKNCAKIQIFYAEITKKGTDS